MYGLIPIRGERNMFRVLDDLERSFWGDIGEGISQFRTDIIDEGDRFLLQAELPGFDRKDIQIGVENGYLNIQAEHKEECEDKRKNFVRRERKYGSFSRSFGLTGINADKVSAIYKNGVLGVSLPKAIDDTKKPVKKIDVQ